MLKVLSNNCIVTDDGDQVYMCVLFMIFCQMSKSERSPEHPGKGRRVHSDSRDSGQEDVVHALKELREKAPFNLVYF